jgi:hypothetical protein
MVNCAVDHQSFHCENGYCLVTLAGRSLPHRLQYSPSRMCSSSSRASNASQFKIEPSELGCEYKRSCVYPTGSRKQSCVAYHCRIYGQPDLLVGVWMWMWMWMGPIRWCKALHHTCRGRSGQQAVCGWTGADGVGRITGAVIRRADALEALQAPQVPSYPRQRR